MTADETDLTEHATNAMTLAAELSSDYETEQYADAIVVELLSTRELLIEPDGDELRVRRVSDL